MATLIIQVKIIDQNIEITQSPSIQIQTIHKQMVMLPVTMATTYG